MARGFMTTDGVASTDLILTGLTANPSTVRSYHIFAYRIAATNVQRFFCSGADISALFFDISTPGFVFNRKWSVTAGQWRITDNIGMNAWYSVGISYDGGATTNDPVMYLNGTSAGVTEIGTPNGTIDTTATAFGIGNRPSDSARCWEGRLAEFAVWNATLDAAEFAALGKGYSPLLIRPASLVEYVPMVRSNVSYKLAAPTITGTAVRNHPRIIMPVGPKSRKLSSSRFKFRRTLSPIGTRMGSRQAS